MILSSARQRAKRKRNAREGGSGKGYERTGGGTSYARAGGKEEPEEWIEDVRRPVHHLCRPTGIAASVSAWRGGMKEADSESETERKRGRREGIE